MISTGLVGWFELSWAWVPVGAAILALDGWPNWRKALVSARYTTPSMHRPCLSEEGSRL